MAKYHLLVLIHGMWGNPIHLAELERVARETYSEPTEEGINLHILTAQTIRDESTYDGVDWGGERVAQEVSILGRRERAEAYFTTGHRSSCSI